MAGRQAKLSTTGKILRTPTDTVGRQSCYDCGAVLGWDMTQERLFCTGDRRHKQNPPHPDFRP